MATVNITVENDADFYRTFIWQDANGVPIDLSNATFVMKARKNAVDATAYLVLATETGEIAILDGPNGQFSIRISQPRLLELSLGSYDQSLIVTMNTLKQRVWSGELTINPGPSR